MAPNWSNFKKKNTMFIEPYAKKDSHLALPLIKSKPSSK